MTDGIGYPQSDPNIINDGNLNWTRPIPPSPPNPQFDAGVDGPGYGVAVDPTGGGTAYWYKDPLAALPLPNDFFSVQTPGAIEVSRTNGLLTSGDNPAINVGQWPDFTGYEFAVNSVDPSAILLSSGAGRVYLSSGPTNGYGKHWFAVANPTDLDGTHANALAFGAPAVGSNALDNLLYDGSHGGKVFVTFTGGGVGIPWKNISTGLTGGPSGKIIPASHLAGHGALRHHPRAASLTTWPTSTAAAPVWVSITGNPARPAA